MAEETEELSGLELALPEASISELRQYLEVSTPGTAAFIMALRAFEGHPVSAELATLSEHTGFTIGVWAGLPNYECGFCQAKYIDKSLILDHVTQHRADQRAEETAGRVVLFDASGKLITRKG